MRKILVLSYFFPPCTLTASNRVQGIVSNLHKFGFYPIVVTRHWNQKNDTPNAFLETTSNTIEHKIQDGYEVYYLPYKSSLRDHCVIKSTQNKWFAILSKVLTFVQLITEPFSNHFVPFSNLYYFSKDYLLKNKEVKHVFISANPFVQFKFGYLLAKKLSIHWIADYRDSWTTNKMAMEVRPFNRYLYKYYCYFEKKWVNSASFFTSVSDSYVKQIESILEINGHTIYNGFTSIQNSTEFSQTKEFNILYSGTLYYNQPIEEFILCLKKQKFEVSNTKVILHFAGLGNDPLQKKRVLDAAKGFETNLVIYEWLNRDAYLQLQTNSDLLLMLPYVGFQGIPSSKLFEYISTSKNILLFGSDNDVIERILVASKLGFVATNETELFQYLERLILAKSSNNSFLNRDSLNVQDFSINFQTKILAELIQKHA